MQQLSRWQQAGRWARVLWQLLRGVWIVALGYPRMSLVQQRMTRQTWCQTMLHSLGVTLHMPQPLPASRYAGQLLVANHISWLDVVALNACISTDFIAKADVQHWPILGWLARKNGTLFLPRNKPSQAQAMGALVAERLQAGHTVLVFPEGTTSPGDAVLPFYPALFQAAIDAACPVQPLALSYHDASGKPSSAAAYAGDTTLGQSLGSIMAAPVLHANIRVCTAIAPDPSWRRRHMAQQARSLILARIASTAAHPTAAVLAAHTHSGSLPPLLEVSP